MRIFVLELNKNNKGFDVYNNSTCKNRIALRGYTEF